MLSLTLTQRLITASHSGELFFGLVAKSVFFEHSQVSF